MNTPLVSIIMPVYQVEQYVEKAIRSVLNQTFSNFELLVVDDGTKDRSGEICDRLAEKDNRIFIIHKKNEGAPVARNTAMEIAKGKYYYFMDSDDWVEPTMLEDMVRLAEENAAELVIAGFFIDTFYNDKDYITDHFTQPSRVYKNQLEFRRLAYRLFDKNMLYTPWNKLWLRSYIDNKNIRYRKTFWDDFPFVMDVIRDVERVVVTEKQYYHFIRARAESETAKYRPEMYAKREEEHTWMLELYKYWDIYDKDSLEMIHRRYIERLIGCMENVTNPSANLTKREKIKLIKKMLTQPQVSISLDNMQARSWYMRIMLLPIRWKNEWMAYQMSNSITKVKMSNVKLFARLKAKR